MPLTQLQKLCLPNGVYSNIERVVDIEYLYSLYNRRNVFMRGLKECRKMTLYSFDYLFQLDAFRFLDRQFASPFILSSIK